MYFKFGGYTHPAGDINMVNMTIRRVYSERHKVRHLVKTMELRGQIMVSTGQDDMKDAIDALEAAYIDGSDAGLYHDDNQPSAHFLDSETSIDGVKVLAIDYPVGGPGQYVNCRDYRLLLQAEYFESTIESQLLWWREALSFEGTSGPRWVFRQTRYGPPRRLFLNNKTTQTIVQTGEAVGLQAYVATPPPLVPDYEHQEMRQLQFVSPRRHRNMFLDYPIRWRYVMELPESLDEYPNFGGVL